MHQHDTALTRCQRDVCGADHHDWACGAREAGETKPTEVYGTDTKIKCEQTNSSRAVDSQSVDSQNAT